MTLASGRRSVAFAMPEADARHVLAARALMEAGHEATLLTAAAAPQVAGVRTVALGADPAPDAVAAAVASAGADLVLLSAAMPRARDVARGARRALAALWLHDLIPLTERPAWRLRLARGLAGLPRRRVTPVPGLDPAAPPDPQARYLPWPVRRDPGVTPGRADAPVTVLALGALGVPGDNLDRVVDALRDAGRSGRARLVIADCASGAAGAPDARYLSWLKAVADDESWIDLRRDPPHAERVALYAQAHVCVLPVEDAALGHGPVEAMAYGAVPVISTGAGAAGYLTDGRDGLRVDVGASGALETALGQLVADTPYRARLAAGARATAEDAFSPAQFVARIEALAAEG